MPVGSYILYFYVQSVTPYRARSFRFTSNAAVHRNVQHYARILPSTGHELKIFSAARFPKLLRNCRCLYPYLVPTILRKAKYRYSHRSQVVTKYAHTYVARLPFSEMPQDSRPAFSSSRRRDLNYGLRLLG